MRRLLTGLMTTALLGSAVTAVAAPAAASEDWALNGTFTATSNGEWARNNDVFHDERSVRATWRPDAANARNRSATGYG